MTLVHAAVFSYAVASRLAYVLFVGIALRRQERDAIYTRRYGVQEGFRRFRRVAALIMNHDAVAFILLCLVTRDTLTLPVPRIAAIAVGAVLVIAGAGIKVWAARTLDRCEPPLRTAMRVALGWWKNASTLLRRMVAVLMGLLALAAGALVFSLLN